MYNSKYSYSSATINWTKRPACSLRSLVCLCQITQVHNLGATASLFADRTSMLGRKLVVNSLPEEVRNCAVRELYLVPQQLVKKQKASHLYGP